MPHSNHCHDKHNDDDLMSLRLTCDLLPQSLSSTRNEELYSVYFSFLFNLFLFFFFVLCAFLHSIQERLYLCFSCGTLSSQAQYDHINRLSQGSSQENCGKYLECLESPEQKI